MDGSPRHLDPSASQNERDASARLVQSYGAASATLASWIDGAGALALLRTALARGIVDAAHTPRTVGEIAEITGVRVQTVVHLCHALQSHGLLDASEGRYVLAPDLALLASTEAPQVLSDLLAAASVKTRALDALGRDGDGTTLLPAAENLVLAAGIGTTALSPARTVAPAAMARSMPELHEAWQAGGRHLEIGCGVGNNLLSIAAAYPALAAVGVEIDGPTAAEVRRRAQLLGLLDRVEIRQMDARDIADVEAFDTAQWSQFFFPSECRPAVMAAAWRAIKPGGYVFLPLIGELAADEAERRDPRQRSIAVNRLLFDSWGIPVRSPAELTAEIEAAGFKVLRLLPGPANPLALTRGMLLAHRP